MRDGNGQTVHTDSVEKHETHKADSRMQKDTMTATEDSDGSSRDSGKSMSILPT
jgi:hypothetical protein